MFILKNMPSQLISIAAGIIVLANTTLASGQSGIENLESAQTEAQVSAAIDKTLGDHKAYQELLRDLKEAVRTDNRQQVASLMSFPIDAVIDGNATTVSDTNMFLAFYDKIMSPEIVAAIQNTAYADVMVNWQGVMLGEGQVWINGICTDDTCSDVTVLVSTLQAGPE